MTGLSPLQSMIGDSHEKWIGRRVLIVGDHPHAGQTAIIAEIGQTSMNGLFGITLQMIDQSEFFVHDPEHLSIFPK